MVDWNDPNNVAAWYQQQRNNPPAPAPAPTPMSMSNNPVYYSNNGAQDQNRRWGHNLSLALKAGAITQNEYNQAISGVIPINNLYHKIGTYPISDVVYANEMNKYKTSHLNTLGYDQNNMSGDEWANLVTDEFEGQYPQPGSQFYQDILSNYGYQPNYYTNGFAIQNMEAKPGSYTQTGTPYAPREAQYGPLAQSGGFAPVPDWNALPSQQPSYNPTQGVPGQTTNETNYSSAPTITPPPASPYTPRGPNPMTTSLAQLTQPQASPQAPTLPKTPTPQPMQANRSLPLINRGSTAQRGNFFSNLASRLTNRGPITGRR